MSLYRISIASFLALSIGLQLGVSQHAASQDFPATEFGGFGSTKFEETGYSGFGLGKFEETRYQGFGESSFAQTGFQGFGSSNFAKTGFKGFSADNQVEQADFQGTGKGRFAQTGYQGFGPPAIGFSNDAFATSSPTISDNGSGLDDHGSMSPDSWSMPANSPAIPQFSTAPPHAFAPAPQRSIQQPSIQNSQFPAPANFPVEALVQAPGAGQQRYVIENSQAPIPNVFPVENLVQTLEPVQQRSVTENRQPPTKSIIPVERAAKTPTDPFLKNSFSSNVVGRKAVQGNDLLSPSLQSVLAKPDDLPKAESPTPFQSASFAKTSRERVDIAMKQTPLPPTSQPAAQPVTQSLPVTPMTQPLPQPAAQPVTQPLPVTPVTQPLPQSVMTQPVTQSFSPNRRHAYPLFDGVQPSQPDSSAPTDALERFSPTNVVPQGHIQPFDTVVPQTNPSPVPGSIYRTGQMLPMSQPVIPMNQPIGHAFPVQAGPKFRPDLGHRAPTPTVRHFGSNDNGEKFDFEDKKKQYPPLSEILVTGRYFVSTGFVFAKPHFQNNTAFSSSSRSFVESTVFDYDSEAAPILRFGFESKFGPGIEFDYFQFDESSQPATFTSNGAVTAYLTSSLSGSGSFGAANAGEALRAIHSIDIETFGVSFFKEVKLPISRINGRFGFQYVSIAQTLDATLANAGDVIGVLNSRSDYRGYGPKFTLEYYRPVGHTPLEFVTTVGGSVMFGRRDQFVENSLAQNFSRVGADELLTVVDFNSGVQYKRDIAENRSVYVRVGTIYSAWIGGGSAVDPSGDFGLRGFSFAVGYNR